MTRATDRMRYLVTGGAGRLGRSVVAAMADAGHDVVSLDLVSGDTASGDLISGMTVSREPGRSEHPDGDHRVTEVVVDLLDRAATDEAFAAARPDAVVHLAAVAVPFSLPDAEIYARNTGIMYHVLEATVRCGARALLVASSPTVIGYGNPAGWLPRYLPLDEDHPLEPWHGYSASKVAMEQLVALAVRRHGDDLRLGVFRPCYVVAPEEWAGAPTQQGHTIRDRLADADLAAVALFNYVDARDAAAFVLRWLERADEVPNGTCFFVGAADALAKAPMSELLPVYLDGLGDLAAGLDGDRPVFDCSRAERLLGWTPRRSWRTELAGAERSSDTVGSAPASDRSDRANPPDDEGTP
ncbi:MAG: NAD(P)-dependent oxidoreductase [Actinomycetota bacterium]|nr:NAD(P)-dependent oxidoreductase [Actinomycetota bacterium]